jgi:hypothetical protein
MGRGPDKHIVRKLTRKYFKFDINRNNFNTAQNLYPLLISTWSRSGMMSNEAKLVQEKIDVCINNDEREFNEIKKISKKLPYELNQMIYKSKTKYHYKGKQKLASGDHYVMGKKDFEEMRSEYKF